MVYPPLSMTGDLQMGFECKANIADRKTLQRWRKILFGLERGLGASSSMGPPLAR